MSRWHSIGATSPLWVPGIILVAIGLVLIAVARRSVRRG